MTYSVLLRDPATGGFAVAVQSHYLAVGAVVPWALAGVGAVATQAVPDRGYGPRGLAALEAGAGAATALRGLVAADEARDLRQVAMIDATGATAVHTGARCLPAAGHRSGDGWCVQGNLLTDESVLDAMAGAITATGHPDPARRLLAALQAGEDAGGDLRGRQSAALLVVSGVRGPAPHDQVLVDLRVDDSAEPITDLARLLERHHAAAALGAAFGLVIDGDEQLPAGLVDAVTAGTRTVEPVLGADNPEGPLWRAVLLARSGRLAEAHTEYRAAAARQPRLRNVGPRLAAAGLLSAEAAAALCDPD
ncbi:DUF1028 domain-containing protein [Mycobacterium koreense]|nr:DUF1028 domain-containing protein [Mycolicibacillus koreensis]MCV7246798.1 DUF1028 domain-containing protein [Mycolicibacillus koreensis]ODR07633.1 hypothetical protein BHQ15_10885 [Mycolicibacillus koreensis]BBY54336.1 hypothetical protein MKOR_15870 [Mycolicibacillus koreensis]